MSFRKFCVLSASCYRAAPKLGGLYKLSLSNVDGGLNCEKAKDEADSRFAFLLACASHSSSRCRFQELEGMKGNVGLPRNYFVLNTGDKIPAIGLGTWQSGGDLCVQAVKTTLSVGYRHIDCAHLYGNEVEVGEALAEAFSCWGEGHILYTD